MNHAATTEPVIIRVATPADFDGMWEIFRFVVATGETYVFAPDTPREDAFAYWFGPGIASYVAVRAEGIRGMYKIVANQRDLGSHVANASFMVHPAAAGQGLGRRLGEHCLAQARAAGFLAMQFNFVISTNTAAVALWQKLGFAIVGRIPGAYRHARLGYVDALVMHRSLVEGE
jgi:L-amino acid N-acyltransferase YncA